MAVLFEPATFHELSDLTLPYAVNRGSSRSGDSSSETPLGTTSEYAVFRTEQPGHFPEVDLWLDGWITRNYAEWIDKLEGAG